MRQIGLLADEKAARRVSDYLLTLDIPNKVLPESKGWSVWVVKEDQRDQATAEFRGFEADPTNLKYSSAKARAESIRREEERKEREHRKNTRKASEAWTSPQVMARTRPVTSVLLAGSVLVAILTRLGMGNETLLSYLFMGQGVVGPLGVKVGFDGLLHGQIWRLITPIFIHFGATHLLFNMYNLVQLGSLIESRKSTRMMLILTMTIAVVSNLGQVVFQGPSMFGGMSGVVCGLFGYVWITGRNDPMSGMNLTQNSVSTFLIFLVVCTTGFLGPIANGAHFTGLAVGMIFAYVEARH